jgi:hypothetical protein
MTMRTGTLALLLLMAACGRAGDADRAGGSGNRSGAAWEGDQLDAAATLVLAASGPGGCAASWDGRPATPQQVRDRSAAAVESGISAAGGVGNVTREALPAIAVEAPSDLGFACADTYLSAVRRAGVVSVLLKPRGEQAAALADFTLSEFGAPPPSVVLAVGRNGVLSWNGEPATLDAISERARQLGGVAAGVEVPPGALELRPAREASFGQVYEALRAVRQARVRAALLLPSVPPARAVPPTAAPAVPPAPVNQAAPAPGGNAAR